MHIIIYIQLTN